MPIPSVLALREMPTALFRVWILVAKSIYYGDNRYVRSVSVIIDCVQKENS